MTGLVELAGEFWPAILAVFVWIGFMIHGRREKQEGLQQGRREVIEDIEESTNEAIERVERVERTTADHNREQLRKLASGSRYNRTRVPEDKAD